MDKIERLKLFCLVAEKQSFAQAAKLLNLPRSNVTYAVQALEKEYEVLLFYRTTRQVTLTHDGQGFYDEAKLVLGQLKELNRFKAHVRHQEGKISLGLPNRMATQIVLPHLSEFQQRYPQVKVLLNSDDGYSNLLEQQLDGVVRLGAVQADYLIAKPIATIPIATYAAPSYLARYGQPQLSQLDGHWAVEYLVDKAHSDLSTLAFANQTHKLPYRVLVQDTESYLNAGLAGLGLIQIPVFDAQAYLASGQLQTVLTDLPPLTVALTILITDRKYRPQYMQDFIAWLEDLLRQYCVSAA
ncbi:LysR family transcriptional regulator [Vitreoscilla massiliensis]|uniref:LysR family transcriptional regulator n=1 Tax=Vitreoscilla massiliensis TaxID=1689272 RepID=A0ABY4E710_9NEIS|nr:LysR family transcriptional regulator [Vitreoscilla massiliensis]UOO91175.1 LysR family transcriptional regulator [Vitreoscilla massiliensis]